MSSRTTPSSSQLPPRPGSLAKAHTVSSSDLPASLARLASIRSVQQVQALQQVQGGGHGARGVAYLSVTQQDGLLVRGRGGDHGLGFGDFLFQRLHLGNQVLLLGQRGTGTLMLRRIVALMLVWLIDFDALPLASAWNAAESIISTNRARGAAMTGGDKVRRARDRPQRRALGRWGQRSHAG